MSTTPLSPAEIAILEFAARAPRHVGARDEAIVRELGMKPTRYYQKLNALLDTPAAWEHSPQLVARLDRMRKAQLGCD
ncbi:DUF3263 domain-containing protein [Corynebacterium sp. 13CS0277]|uniref:DUF3263 domain-containing protein n=1 Tax=Corynebacterium sp. 13CS0277 TaxID=2071994 RepID=UPI000D03D041|nr:DUF3263 domain-containing protein [Corynebacterium sp. 13CS0277]PRQ10580.1 DUF3263 domain-containing protein [Corynebacterium sp. 13CS0277]